MWHIEEFKKLLYNETRTEFGAIYGCHKKDGHVCVGWLINQREQSYPSIMLRLSFLKNDVRFEYLESLISPSPLFESVEEMCIANYPRHFKLIIK